MRWAIFRGWEGCGRLAKAQLLRWMRDVMEGTELRSRRIRAGVSRDQVAHALGVDVPTLQAWENDGAPIAFPSAVEVVLRKLEASRDDRESAPGYHHN